MQLSNKKGNHKILLLFVSLNNSILTYIRILNY